MGSTRQETRLVMIEAKTSQNHQVRRGRPSVDQLVNKSTSADLRATKMLFDMVQRPVGRPVSRRRRPNGVDSTRHATGGAI
jgi:hypothetical protein